MSERPQLRMPRTPVEIAQALQPSARTLEVRYDALLHMAERLVLALEDRYANNGCGACGARWYSNDGEGHFNGCAYQPLREALRHH